MRLSEEEITNAICLHFASRLQKDPTAVEVQLLWDEEMGFSAQIWVGERDQFLVQSNMIEAIGRYLFNEQGIRVFPDQIQLKLEEEIYAEVLV
jgi:hypothetical protein